MPSETRTCQNCKNRFAIEPEDFDFYKKIQVPPPTFCPDCRDQRRILVRNERSLYKDECDLCSKSMLSLYSPDKPFQVYCKECWYSDGWDSLTYAREYDFSKPFFKQFRELMEAVPRIALMQVRSNTNADYANFLANDKNVYLAYSIVDCENVFYSRVVDKSKDCFDSFNISNSEIIYENVDGHRNYNSKYLLRSRDCLNSSFLFDCASCQDCFLSANLRNKQYVFRNRQLGKTEYQQELAALDLGSRRTIATLAEEFTKLTERSLHKFANIVKATNCTGDNIENAKNAQHSFDVYNSSENLKFCNRIIGAKDAYDIYGSGGGSELVYEGMACTFGSYNSRFVMICDAAKDSEYIDFCLGSSSLFGCASLRSKEFCILNKQYSKEAFNDLRTKIIEHMDAMPYVDGQGKIYKYGEFFPPELSPFAYNETIAQEYAPLTKEEVLQRGFRWKESDSKSHQATILGSKLPDCIDDASADILNQVIGCEHEGKCLHQCTVAFKVVPEELAFYRRLRIPLPVLCPNCRHYARLAKRNPLKLWHRRCMCPGQAGQQQDPAPYANTSEHFHGSKACPNEFETSYSPDRPETVYCEQCYQSEVA